LADKLGVDHSYISNLESGKKGITLALLYQLYEVLGVSIDALFSEDSDSEIINNIDTILRRLTQENLEKKERETDKKYQELDEKEKELENAVNEQMEKLQQIARLSVEEAKKLLLTEVEKQIKEEMTILAQTMNKLRIEYGKKLSNNINKVLEELEMKKVNIKNYLDAMEMRGLSLRFEQEKLLKSIIPIFPIKISFTEYILSNSFSKVTGILNNIFSFFWFVALKM